jgi:hypothetical protein
MSEPLRRSVLMTDIDEVWALIERFERPFVEFTNDIEDMRKQAETQREKAMAEIKARVSTWRN